MRKFLRSNGMTLVELLVAITLLLIISVFFLNIFPQSMSYSRKAEDKLIALNLAEKVLNDERNGSGSKSCFKIGSAEDYTLNDKNYYSLVDVAEPSDFGLRVIRVEIYSDDPVCRPSNLLTQIYGYQNESGGER